MEHKILFTGTTGAGKTTAIGAVSEIKAINSDVTNTDQQVNKNLTTVGLDYGELTLENGDKLRLYGTPGQKRFDFMWQILGRGALGLIILVDNRQEKPLDDLKMYVDGFKSLIDETACVVAIVRTETHPLPSLDEYACHLETQGIVCPILAIDVRQRQQVIDLLELLVLQLEAKQDSIYDNSSSNSH